MGVATKNGRQIYLETDKILYNFEPTCRQTYFIVIHKFLQEVIIT